MLPQGYQADPDLAEESASRLTGLPFTSLWPTHDISTTGYTPTEALYFNKTIGEVDREFVKWDAGYMPKRRKRKPAAQAAPDKAAKPSLFQYSVPKAEA